MHRSPASPIASAVLVFAAVLPAQAVDATAPMVAIVAADASAARLDGVLATAGLRRRRVAIASCTPDALRFADVVVIDCPEANGDCDALPLGDLDRWDRPTVLVGAAGVLVARRFLLPTAAQIADLAPERRGPEMQLFEPVGTATTTVWRQGNLFHFRAAVDSIATVGAESAWFVEVVRRAATFVIDRPIVRFAVAIGAEPSPEEAARRERIATSAAWVGGDVRTRSVLATLPGFLGGRHGAEAKQLLADIVVGGPGADTTPRNWVFWFRPRLDHMVWDALSETWRMDELARVRGERPEALVGDARADGRVPDAASRALALEVVRWYGGRALDDLATFTCRCGERHYSWDRRTGVFRVENHFVVPRGNRATAWSVAVFDTARDEDLIRGGGPPPRPTVSARQDFRELVMNAFLPALLFAPGTTLTRNPDEDEADERALDVRLVARGYPDGIEVRLWIGPDGAIRRLFDVRRHHHRKPFRLEATTQLGPLSVPTSWSEQTEDNPVRYVIDETAWNPTLPGDLATAKEKLTKPRPQ